MSLELAVQRWPEAKRVCVVGAGTMGGGIAGHLANLGFDVYLLDVDDRAAANGLERVRSSKPPHLFLPEFANRISTGGLDDHHDWLMRADWIVEAVVEKLDVKRQLFQRIATTMNPSAMVSTNTSGLQLALLAEGMPDAFRERFVGSHFFNPPRYLKLLELIPAPDTHPLALQAMTRFLEDRVARRVVPAKDTPGFIANRYGMWAMFHAIRTAEKLQMTVEEVDAITGPFLGRPRSGSFRLNDLVGLDIMMDIARNIHERCPHDAHRDVLFAPASLARLLERGWLGEKAGQGYYRREGRELMALDLVTFAYRERREPELPSLKELGRLPLGQRIAAALDLRDPVGEFLRHHLVPVLQYADHIKSEIAHNVRDIDRVMQWGFGWEAGPFAIMDAVGHEKLGIRAPGKFYAPGAILGFDGEYKPVAPEPDFATIEDFPVVKEAGTFSVRDLGDGVMAIATRTKMGVFTPGLVEELSKELTENEYGPLVLTSEAKVFSAGYDLKFILSCVDSGDWDGLNAGLAAFQGLGEILARHRIVAAVNGFCLGGGWEMATACAATVYGPECTVGLPEAKVGVVPGGGGLARLRVRYQHEPRALAEMALKVNLGMTSVNAEDAKRLGFVRETDRIEPHPDKVLSTAKRMAMEIGTNVEPAFAPLSGPFAGLVEQAQDRARKAGDLTEHDDFIGDRIKAAFGKSQSFQDTLDSERREFLTLCKRALSVARIRHMVENGKPLRN